jgi:hypothetical protein
MSATISSPSSAVANPATPSLPGFNVMLMGPSGTGKTHAIGTLIDAGIEVFYFAYEAGSESLVGYYTDRGLPVPPNLHICTVRAPTASFLEMADAVRYVNTLSFEGLIKQVDPAKSKYNQLEQFLRNFNDVTDDTGAKYGDVLKWGPDRALVIDGLTGLCDSAMKACIGGKFARDQKDWGLAQNIVEGILRKITSEARFHFVLIAHVERETDPNGGGLKLMASALGRALAPKLPAMFSDVILTKRIGREFFWDTEDPTADLKTRNLPISGKLPPSFAPVVEKWKSRSAAR